LHTLVQAVHGSQQFSLVVVRNVELQAHAHVRYFDRTLPGAFGLGNGMQGGLSRGGEPVRTSCALRKRQRQRRTSLLPEAADTAVVRLNRSLILRANRSDSKPQGAFLANDLGRFHAIDGLIQAVELGVPLALSVLGKMQHKMKFGLANL